MERHRIAPAPGLRWERLDRRALTALATVAALAVAPAAAAACPGDPPALAPVPAEARLAFLRHTLDAARGPGHRWTVAWALTDSALAAGQIAAIPFTSDTAGRVVLASGAAASGLALVQMAFLPVTIAPLPPPGSAADACAELTDLERMLDRGARNQALGTGNAAHLGNFVINASLGIGSGLAAGRWWDGAIAFAIGLALGEAQIRTQPTALVQARERYYAGDLGRASAPPPRIGLGDGAMVSLELRF